MKILIVSWYFPPVNTIGAVRTGKFARFLAERGHEIGVVAGKYWGHPETMPLGMALDRIVYAKSIDVNAAPQRLSKLLKHTKDGKTSSTQRGNDFSVPRDGPDAKALRRRLGELYLHATNIPDNRIGWLPWAYRGCLQLCRSWSPDLIFASGPPFTAHIVAAMTSHRLHIPWVAELRDRWADDPYEVLPSWRAHLDHWLERRTLTTASGLVTVSEPWAAFYRAKYGKPLAMILNGYDPADFQFPLDENLTRNNDSLIIGYTGGIYPGKRDPTPLFAAIQRLGEEGKKIRVIFCGTDPAHVFPLAERAGVKDQVEVRPPIPYHDSLAFQRHADVLLLMQWNDPREQGSCPGKLFEYVASLRPILVLGLENGVPATIVQDSNAGICANDSSKIAAQLRIWLQQKLTLGEIPTLPKETREGFTRTTQYRKLELFLENLLATGPNAVGSPVRQA